MVAASSSTRIKYLLGGVSRDIESFDSPAMGFGPQIGFEPWTALHF